MQRNDPFTVEDVIPLYLTAMAEWSKINDLKQQLLALLECEDE